MNRREFLKVAGVTTAVTGTALATKQKKSFALEIGKEQDDYPYEVTEDCKGFSAKDIMFMRGFWDNDPYDDEYIKKTYKLQTPVETAVTFAGLHHGFIQKKVHDPNKKGFRFMDNALSLGAWSVDNNFATNSEFGVGNALVQTHPINPMTGEKMKDTPVFVPGLYSWDNSKVDNMLAMGKPQEKFKDAKDAAKHVKKAAKFLGADLVGIAPYNERTKRWTYTEWPTPSVRPEPYTMPDGLKMFMPFDPFKAGKGEFKTFGVSTVKADFKGVAGFEPKSIIVLAFEQDYDAFKATPTPISDAAAAKEYSRMAEASCKIAEFLRHMGYKAIPCGNDTSISVPLAIEAGLGESSRMGMIVTQKYGPRVRLAKIYTDLEIQPDKPITFGVKEFCNVCMKCADACPGRAICHEPARVIKEGMEFDTGKVTKSTMTGVEKWFVNGERCLSFWSYNEAACGTCVSVCPYNKIDEWHHDLSKLMTLTPFKPLLRSLDEMFGYGGPIEPDVRLESKYLTDAVDDFWGKL
ncbi:reductive dehalogenase [Romboutsia sp.]|uniref:reductive dehalogenase n=1 Tax=Romboutsia sp. TaxID=1965302 RepID=UPI002CAC97AE|nr:reductive dehalogenase [Romboutsia sp.]HSQ87734.1 reductive dehalogenase [Romboutsia sp.]